MGKEENIQRGGLAGKMAGYTPEPPGTVWEGISAEIGRGGSRRKFFIFLAAAAGLALAVTVGVLFFDSDLPQEIAVQAPLANGERADKAGPVTPAKNEPSMEKEALPEKEPHLDNKPDLKEARRLQAPSAEKSVQQKKDIEGTVKEAKVKKPASGLEEKVRLAVQEVLDGGSVNEGMVHSESGIEIALADSAGSREDEVLEKETAAVPAVQNDSLLVLPEMEIAIDPDPSKKEQSGRWQLGASLSPLYNYRDVSSQNDFSKALANSSESARMTFAGGVQVSYQQSDRLTVESGLYYTRMGVNIGDYSNFRNGWYSERLDASPGSVENVVSISNSMGKIVSAGNDLFVGNYGGSEAVADYHMLYPELMMVDNSIVESFSQSLDYMEIPLNIKYKIFDRSVQVQLIGGVSTNVMINNSVSAHTGEGTMEIGEVQDLRRMNYSGNAGLGFVYDLFESFSLSVEPKFRYYLHSVNTDLLPSTRPYTFGLYTGVNYTF